MDPSSLSTGAGWMWHHLLNKPRDTLGAERGSQAEHLRSEKRFQRSRGRCEGSGPVCRGLPWLGREWPQSPRANERPVPEERAMNTTRHVTQGPETGKPASAPPVCPPAPHLTLSTSVCREDVSADF